MKNKRINKRYLKRNSKNLFKNGYNLINDIYIKTQDFDFQKYLNIPIKDVLKEINNDNNFYLGLELDKNHFKNVKVGDIISDWWTYGKKNKNKMKYLTITTPHIRSEDIIDIEIMYLMSTHYNKIFGYKREKNEECFKFYKIPNSKFYSFEKNRKYRNIKTTYELIKEWIEKNKNSKEYLFYKNLIEKENEYMLTLKEPIMIKSKNESNFFIIVIPFFYEKTYSELFQNLNNLKILNKNDYLEEHIEKYLIKNEENKIFLNQFKNILIR